jgi:MFS family permease
MIVRARATKNTGTLRSVIVVAWFFALIFYFLQYALRSAPGVMIPELSAAFNLTALGVSAVVGIYYYGYSLLSIVAGASLDRYGAKYTVSIGAAALAVGAVMFGLGTVSTATVGRLLQGAGSAFAFTGAVYLAAQGFPARYLATIIGITQSLGMLGGAAGQFAVGPLISGGLPWQQFWLYAGGVVLLVAVLLLVVAPSPDASAGAQRGSTWSMFAPYKVVLTNPQSYLCGFTAGLLFVPTTIGDMIWGVPFLRDGLGVEYAQAVTRASMVPLGWMIGAPALGYLADCIGRRKPVVIGGAVGMLIIGAAVVYLHDYLPPYIGGLLFGFASGAAMIPYSIIKEVNPDGVKGSATGAMNFLVFTFSALLAPGYGWLLLRLSGGNKLGLPEFHQSELIWAGSIALAIVLAFFLKETGVAVQREPTH